MVFNGFSGNSRFTGFLGWSPTQGGFEPGLSHMFPAGPGFEPGLSHMFPAGPGFEPGLNHMFLARRRFGRNLAPPGSFRDFLGPSESRSCCSTLYILPFQWFGLLRPQFAIYWIFQGLGDVDKFRGRPGNKNGSKKPGKWIFPVLGAVLGAMPADEI